VAFFYERGTPVRMECKDMHFKRGTCRPLKAASDSRLSSVDGRGVQRSRGYLRVRLGSFCEPGQLRTSVGTEWVKGRVSVNIRTCDCKQGPSSCECKDGPWDVPPPEGCVRFEAVFVSGGEGGVQRGRGHLRVRRAIFV
jgi:hypothetical protein